MDRVQRRDFLVAVGALLGLPLAVEAQQPAKSPRIGFLAFSSPNLAAEQLNAFREGLRDLGYAEGRNIVIEYRDAKGETDRLPALAAELVALKVDVILAAGTQHVLAAKQATTTIPIVFADVADPVARGFVTSLARPGGNITGLSNLNTDLVGKWLELLTQAVPGVKRVAFLWQPGYLPERAEKDVLQRAEVAAQALGVRLQFVEARRPEDFDRAFAEMTRARVDAVIVWGGVLFIFERKRIADLAARNRLPSSYPMSEFVDAGGLISYAPNIADNFRRSAGYVDKILKGAKPADLPVEQSSKLELVINVKTAKALGLTLPPSLLQRADRVIE
jgi:putative tryptophan/tyrosine transport system substrate-binding protein